MKELRRLAEYASEAARRYPVEHRRLARQHVREDEEAVEREIDRLRQENTRLEAELEDSREVCRAHADEIEVLRTDLATAGIAEPEEDDEDDEEDGDQPIWAGLSDAVPPSVNVVTGEDEK